MESFSRIGSLQKAPEHLKWNYHAAFIRTLQPIYHLIKKDQVCSIVSSMNFARLSYDHNHLFFLSLNPCKSFGKSQYKIKLPYLQNRLPQWSHIIGNYGVVKHFQVKRQSQTHLLFETTLHMMDLLMTSALTSLTRW